MIKKMDKQVISIDELNEIISSNEDLNYKEILEKLRIKNIVIKNKEDSIDNELYYKMYQMALKNNDFEVLDHIQVLLLNSEKNKAYIKKLSNKYAFNKDYLEDLKNAGYEGILHALRTYNEEKGTSFNTYLYQTILYYIMDCSYSFQDFKISSGVRNKINALKKMLEDFKNLGEDEIIKKFENEYNVDHFKALEYYEIIKRNKVYSLNSNSDDSLDPILDNLRGNFLTPEENFFLATKNEALYNAIDSLSDKEKELIYSYYGLNNKEQKSLEELALKYHVSKQRISFIIRKALLKLKESLELNDK